MKNKITKTFTAVLLTCSLMTGSAISSCGSAYISKPAKRSKTAAEYYTGRTTYYNPDTQKWIKIKTEIFYTYKAKKDARYYRPLYYLTSSWLSNNKQNLTVHLGQNRSKSVSKVVQSTLGVSAPNTSLATSISSNYSSTVSTSYTTDYTFVMKNYSSLYYYRPALFGNIMKYGVIKSHRFTNRATVLYSYTFDSGSGLYLKLARKF